MHVWILLNGFFNFSPYAYNSSNITFNDKLHNVQQGPKVQNHYHVVIMAMTFILRHFESHLNFLVQLLTFKLLC